MKYLLKMLDLSRRKFSTFSILQTSSNTKTKTVSSITFLKAKLSE